jgi:hypothetical protein
LTFPKNGTREKDVQLNKRDALIKLATELETYGFKIEIDYKKEKIKMN